MRRAHAAALVFCSCAGFLSVQPAFAEYLPKGKRDPFVPLITPDGQKVYPPGLDEEITAGMDSFALQGIVFDPNGDSFAVINGEVVHEDDELDGIIILKIDPNMVTVLVDGKEDQLTLSQPIKENETEP